MAPACALVQSTPGSTFTTLIQTIMASYCALNVDEYPTNRAEEIFASKKEEFDFIIVGSGSAGSILASRLTEIEDWDVLLIERGEDPLPETYSPALFIKNINGPQNYHYLVNEIKFYRLFFEKRESYLTLTCLRYIEHDNTIVIIFLFRNLQIDYTFSLKHIR